MFIWHSTKRQRIDCSLVNTKAEPDYRRDEKFQRHYAEAAGSDESWSAFVQRFLSGSEADYQAAVRAFAEEQKEAQK